MRLKPIEERNADWEPARWLLRPAGGTEAEDRLAALFRAAETQPELGATGRARVWASLRRVQRSGRPQARLRWGLVAALLLVSGVVFGAMSAHKWFPRTPAETRPTLPLAKPRTTRAEQPPGDLAPPVLPPTATAVQSPGPPPARASSTKRARAAAAASHPRDLALATAPPTPATHERPSEANLLGEALARLRQKGDARGALATLDFYRSRFPDGTLKREADSARIDALLLLGRDDEALSELHGLSFEPRGRDQELRLIRGELVAAKDCRRALVDFDRILADEAPAPLLERALHGRAACRVRLGDETGARRDLAEYLRRFPAGRFASEARRTVGGDL